MSPKPRPVVLITGASSGIGHATALALAARGWIVYGAARRVDRMQELEAAGCQVIAMDVTDDASLRAGVDRIIREQRRLDVLVNNAGYGSYGALEDVPIDEARRQFEAALSIDPALTLDPVLVSPKTVEFFDSRSSPTGKKMQAAIEKALAAPAPKAKESAAKTQSEGDAAVK